MADRRQEALDYQAQGRPGEFRLLLGMTKPVHTLRRGCCVRDGLNLAAVASVDWQARSGQI